MGFNSVQILPGWLSAGRRLRRSMPVPSSVSMTQKMGRQLSAIPSYAHAHGRPMTAQEWSGRPRQPCFVTKATLLGLDPSSLCIATVASWACVAVPLLLLSPSGPSGYSWAPDESYLLVSGWPGHCPSRCAGSNYCKDCECSAPLIAVLVDGSIAGHWHHFRNTQGECRWNLDQVHFHEPIWSEGIPGHVPPHHPDTCQIVSPLPLDQYSDEQPGGLWSESPCGSLIVKLHNERHGRHVKHLIWNGATQALDSCDTKLQATYCFEGPVAWHPHLACSPLHAIVEQT